MSDQAINSPSTGSTFSILDNTHINAAAFSWSSIALAVFTALLQGLISALAFMTESSGQWTFRFRLAVVEHLWWTFISVLLLVSLIMSAIAFTAGKGGDPVSVLALSSATFLAMVQYMVPAWQRRDFVQTRWYAWTGASRTAIKGEYEPLCGGKNGWKELVARLRPKLAKLQRTPTDYYGWVLWPTGQLAPDPTDVFRVVSNEELQPVDSEKAMPAVGIYSTTDSSSPTISLLWGQMQDFSPRVSRAISAMPLTLLSCSPTTVDGYDERGLKLAWAFWDETKVYNPRNLFSILIPE
jgi:hypothetical protein